MRFLEDFRGPAPTALKAVALLFVLQALWALVRMATRLGAGEIFLDLGVLGFLIGPRLLRGVPGWRGLALVFLCIDVVVSGMGLVTVALARDPVWEGLSWFVGASDSLRRGAFAAVCLALLALAAWQIRVLTRLDVQERFAS